MALRPIILNGPGQPKRKLPTQRQVGPSSAAVGPAEYLWGTHSSAINAAEQIKSAIWRSARAAVATGLGAFVVSAPQVYADQQSTIFKSVVAGQKPPVIPVVSAAPQLADLTQQAWLSKPVTTPQGRLAQLVFAPAQPDPSQSSWVRASQPAPLVVVTAVPQFISATQSLEDRPTSQVWSAQIAGKTPRVITSLWAASQQYDFTQQASFSPAQSAPILVGAVPPFVQAAVTDLDQTTGYQIPALFFAPLPPAIIQPQQPGGEDYRHFTLRPRNVYIARYAAELEPIGEIVEPESRLLEAVSETLKAAEAQAEPVHREISVLSALEVLSKAYGAHFDSAKAARAAIEERKAEIVATDEDEIIAMMMIIAATDDPT